MLYYVETQVVMQAQYMGIACQIEHSWKAGRRANKV